MRINTRTEVVDGVTYCAYCGKLLRDYNMIACCPEPPLVCSCEKAKMELSLYDELEKLYKLPLSENVIEAKVAIYRRKLMGEYREKPRCTISNTRDTYYDASSLASSYDPAYTEVSINALCP